MAYRQCLAWDGIYLAALEDYSDETGATTFHYTTNNLPFPSDTKLGKLSMLVLSAPREYHEAVHQMLGSYEFCEFMRFYRNATQYSLLKDSFQFMLIAVFEEKVIGMDVRSGKSYYIKADRKVPVAVGQDAGTALVLMNQKLAAEVAVTAQFISVYGQSTRSIDRVSYIRQMEDGVVNFESIRHAGGSLPKQRLESMRDIF